MCMLCVSRATNLSTTLTNNNNTHTHLYVFHSCSVRLSSALCVYPKNHTPTRFVSICVHIATYPTTRTQTLDVPPPPPSTRIPPPTQPPKMGRVDRVKCRTDDPTAQCLQQTILTTIPTIRQSIMKTIKCMIYMFSVIMQNRHTFSRVDDSTPTHTHTHKLTLILTLTLTHTEPCHANNRLIVRREDERDNNPSYRNRKQFNVSRFRCFFH